MNGTKSSTEFNHYRPSASVIMAIKNDMEIDYNYSVLLLKRTLHTAFAPNHCVFPGGVFDMNADECLDWLQHFESLGVTQPHLEKLHVFAENRPHPLLTEGHCFSRDISLRITAIRETFEEVGVLLCRNKETIDEIVCSGSKSDSCIAHFKEDFNREEWQYRVHQNPMEFLKLCQIFQIVPDLWSLHEWSIWRSSATATKKYDTIYYLAALQKQPSFILEPEEVEMIRLQTPSDLLNVFNMKLIWLPPTQFYEISLLKQFPKWSKLLEFAYVRNKKGASLFQPVHYQCKNGLIATLPGDDFYPNNVEKVTKTIQLSLSMQEFRELAKVVHRYIIHDMNDYDIEVNTYPINRINRKHIESKL